MNVLEKVNGIEKVKVLTLTEDDTIIIVMDKGLNIEGQNQLQDNMCKSLCELYPNYNGKVLFINGIEDITVVKDMTKIKEEEKQQCQSKTESTSLFKKLIQTIRCHLFKT